LTPHHQPDDANRNKQSKAQANAKPLGLIQPGEALGQRRINGNGRSGKHGGVQFSVARFCTTDACDYLSSLRKH
jgi:hypothetical protein